MIKFFKVISFLEGLSYVLLLFVATPIKYFANNEFFVKALGMPHGILFLAYIVLALIIRPKMNWNLKTTFMVLIASVIPFGTFYIIRKYFENA